MEESAKVVSEVSIGRELCQVSGIVTYTWSHRSIEDGQFMEIGDGQEYEDDGPLSSRFEGVHNITISSGETSGIKSCINVFFYDSWAEKSDSICSGDFVTITGFKDLVFENRHYESADNEHRCCLAFRTEREPITSPIFEV